MTASSQVRRFGSVGWLLVICLFAVAPCEASEPQPKDNAIADAKNLVAQNTPRWVEQTAPYLAMLGTVITLMGAAASLLPQLAESISLRSRRKRELEHVEALAELMAKIKKDDALTGATRESVALQVEAEIGEALKELQANRLKRQKVLQAKAASERPELSFAQRAFLWYRPHGLMAWIAHVLAFSVSVTGLLMAFVGMLASDGGQADHWFVGAVLIGVLLWWLPFRALALRERRRWRTSHPSAAAPA